MYRTQTVDTSQPKSFAHRSSSLHRAKKAEKEGPKKAVIVPISISPSERNKVRNNLSFLDAFACNIYANYIS